MTEECAACGSSFSSPAALIEHTRKEHSGPLEAETLAMNPESKTAGLVCALCGARFRGPRELAAHNLRPHPRGSLPRGDLPVFKSA